MFSFYFQQAWFRLCCYSPDEKLRALVAYVLTGKRAETPDWMERGKPRTEKPTPVPPPPRPDKRQRPRQDVEQPSSRQ